VLEATAVVICILNFMTRHFLKILAVIWAEKCIFFFNYSHHLVEINLTKKCELDENDSDSCPVVSFGVTNVELPNSVLHIIRL
jgi:hypothetical protein